MLRWLANENRVETDYPRGSRCPFRWTKQRGFWERGKKITSQFIILFVFNHNSSSNNSRKTRASKLLTHRFSAGCVGGFLAILTFSLISLHKFRDEAS